MVHKRICQYDLMKLRWGKSLSFYGKFVHLQDKNKQKTISLIIQL